MGNDTTTTALNPSHYAGFWVRFLSVCIDLVFFTPIYFGVKYALGDSHKWVAECLFVVLTVLWYAIFFSSRWQATLGMHILKFHICDTEGNRISFGRAIVWLVTSLASWTLCFAGVIYVQSRFDVFGVQDLMMSCVQQNLSNDDCVSEVESLINFPFLTFMKILYAALALFGFLALIWTLSIVLPKDKSGFHNLICGTRFVSGRPNASGHEIMPDLSVTGGKS